MNNGEDRKANRLISEKSPYLLQHAYNPVDWYPWGEEAFSRAQREDKPVFLSIGYSTCHWCHVMERESFEDEEVAALLNRDFIAIKVDREERPDLDQVYMAACQAFTGQGGWPLTALLTPEKKPFFAGTYFPKHSRYGLYGMVDLLPKVGEIWKNERSKITEAAAEVMSALHQRSHETVAAGDAQTGGEDLNAKPLEEAYRKFLALYDRKNGGFGGAPKFPSPHQLEFLLRYYRRSGTAQALEMALETLNAMHRGGIFDQIGFGMHRYAVDERWLVPHFEKMLYDQATTALAALEAFKVTEDEEAALFARRVLDYVLTGLASPEGPFYAAEDADSEGEEGTFYVWQPQEIYALLGPEKGRLVCAYFGVTEEGNFEKGNSVLHRAREDQAFAARHHMSVTALEHLLEEARPVLLAARHRRERPFRDDKIITAWNGLMIAALARGAAVLREPRYLEAASRAAAFILEKMTDEKGRLLRRYREGEAAIAAFLDDYASLARGMIELYLAGGERGHLASAERLTREMLALFDAGGGSLKYSAPQKEAGDLAFNPDAEDYDGAIPSGVSLAAMNLVTLGRLLGDERLQEKGEALIGARLGQIENKPTAFSYLLCALDEALRAQANEGMLYCSPDGSCDLG